MTTTIPFRSEEQWLAERVRDVTSTEVAALFDLSPYVTRFELWHRKRDRIFEQMEPNERVTWGRRLQDTIAAGVAEDRGWNIRRKDDYMRDEAARLGASFDFDVTCPQMGAGLMEVKNVDRLVFLDEWLETPRGIEAPQHIELQVQQQMEVSGIRWCAIVALVGGNEAKVTVRQHDPVIAKHIRQRAAEFWQSIDDGVAPRPNYDQDAEFMSRLYGRARAGTEHLADAETEALLSRFVELGRIAKERDAIKAQVLERIGTAARVRTSFGTFTCSEVAANAGTTITPEMVGQTVGAREGFRMFRFNPPRKIQ